MSCNACESKKGANKVAGAKARKGNEAGGRLFSKDVLAPTPRRIFQC
jgi:hypothetical protein